ncbi:hypothetical protein THAOC_31257, partial [Thalassiosira oceanica]
GMSGEEGEKHDAKRQRTEGGGPATSTAGSTAAQRSAFAEDAARIRSLLAGGPPSAEPTAAAAPSAAAPAAGSRHERPMQPPQQPPRPDDDSDEEEGGGGSWLTNYTAHRTRVGEAYQVSSLPVPPAGSSSSATHGGRRTNRAKQGHNATSRMNRLNRTMLNEKLPKAFKGLWQHPRLERPPVSEPRPFRASRDFRFKGRTRCKYLGRRNYLWNGFKSHTQRPPPPRTLRLRNGRLELPRPGCRHPFELRDPGPARQGTAGRARASALESVEVRSPSGRLMSSTVSICVPKTGTTSIFRPCFLTPSQSPSVGRGVVSPRSD